MHATMWPFENSRKHDYEIGFQAEFRFVSV